MNKILARFLFCLFTAMSLSGMQIIAQEEGEGDEADVTYQFIQNAVPLKQPVITQSMKPAVAEYKKGNYLGAMVELEKVTAREPRNTYANYYLALCYTQLGYKDKAEQKYKEVIEANDNYALSYYSKRATVCISDPNNEICALPDKPKLPVGGRKGAQPGDEDDITQFIHSGRKIHPAAMDKITNERMIRKIQADLYSRQQMSEAANASNN